jgi:hypothetical protein
MMSSMFLTSRPQLDRGRDSRRAVAGHGLKNGSIKNHQQHHTYLDIGCQHLLITGCCFEKKADPCVGCVADLGAQGWVCC